MNKKLVIIIVSVMAVVALALGGIGFFIGYNSGSFGNKADDDDRNDGDRTTLHSESQADPSDNNGTQNDKPNGSQSVNQGTSQSGNQNGNQNGQSGNQNGALASQLIGVWRDGTGTSGFEFKADGRAVLTYIDLGFIGFDTVIGDLTGVYTLEGDKLTIDTSFYAGTITIGYTASVSDNTLTLVSTNNGAVFTYVRAEDTDTDVGGDVNELQPGQTGIVGNWKDGAGASGFNFKDNGTVSFTYIDLQFIGYDDIAGSYDGTYTVDGDTVTIKFSIVYGVTITLNYTYEVSGSTLKMTDEKGNSTTYIRQ